MTVIRTGVKMGKASTAGKKSLGLPTVTVRLEHAISPFAWRNQPGIEFWYASMVLGYESGGSSKATVAHVSLCRADLLHQVELGYELDNIDADLGSIGFTIERSANKLADHSIGNLMNSTIVIATDAVVARRWRGNRLGPSLLQVAAQSLRADAVIRTGFDGCSSVWICQAALA